MILPPPDEPEKRTWRRAGAALFRPALLGLGWLCLCIGVAGVFLPLVPGTVFLILAAACFARSSPRFEAWLMTHPHLGPPVRRWRETGSIPRAAKAFALASLAASGAIIVATQPHPVVTGVSLMLLCAVALYIATRP